MREGLAALEQETAKEILAEVFCIRPSEAEEMILSRSREARRQEISWEEGGHWPQEFRADG